MPKPIARRLKKHIDEKSVFKHTHTVHRPDEKPIKVIKFDHRTLRQSDRIPVHVHRHKATPSPQIVRPPSLREIQKRPRIHRFNVTRQQFKASKPASPEKLIKQVFVENPQNPFLTYYAPAGGSFGVVGKHHMQNLPHAGWNVRWVLLKVTTDRKMGYPSQIGIIHPLLYWGIPGWASATGRQHYRMAHEKIAGFEVADSDAIGAGAISLVNKVDLLMVPSETAKAAFVNSGAEIPVEVVPHGLSDVYSSPKNSFSSIPEDGVKILYFQLHSRWRKGGDVVEKVMARILKERKDVKLVLRLGANKELAKLPQTICLNWLSERDLVHLYDSCDILFAPSRGGACELNVLESLARGLVVVTSSYPSIKEYAEGALFIKDKGQVRVLPGNSIHVGNGSDPDPDHTYELMNYAIDNLVELKKKAEVLAPKFREKYSWKNTAERMAEVLGRLAA
ncbi:hypothetical protein ES702_00385 [subsurface metagenome]